MRGWKKAQRWWWTDAGSVPRTAPTAGAGAKGDGGGAGGFFLGGCLFDRVRPEMSIYTDEIFGPVLSLVRAKSYEEALSSSTITSTGTGPRSSPATATRRATSRPARRSG